MNQKIPKHIILAGATGDLGGRIASYLINSGASVTALVRKGSHVEALRALGNRGMQIKEVDFNNHNQLVTACVGGSCLVSALNGLEDVIIRVQTALLKAAEEAGVPRFIPSDYCIDFTRLEEGGNRNLDLRRNFANILNASPIKATSILNGMFTNLLAKEAPVILLGMKRVVYWENAEQKLDFTTIDNTAEFTAYAALDENTPRFLRIAGEVTHAKGLAASASRVTGKEFKLFRPGGLKRLKKLTSITKTLFPQKKEVFPPWQGMQYLHDMFTGKPKLEPLDNHRYPQIHWTSVQELLTKQLAKNQ